MDSTMDSWKVLLVEMEQFEEAMVNKFNCELHELNTEKINAAGLLKAQLVEWLESFAEMHSNLRSLTRLKCPSLKN